MTDKNKVIDICCGMGGLSFAAKKLGAEPILGIDIWDDALKTYDSNFPETQILNDDITNTNIEEKILDFIRKRKINNKKLYIVSGPPCQGFSSAGKRQKDDPRNFVITKVASIISHIKPKAAVIENVSTINHPRYSDITKHFSVILSQAGYYMCDIELNAIDFGIPQRRKRRFYFITKKKVSKNKYMSFIRQQHKKPPVIRELFKDLPKAVERPNNYFSELSNNGVFNHFSMQHSNKVKAKISSIPAGKGPLSYRKLDPDGYAPTLICGHRAPPVHFSEDRSITAREAARIQGFPDNFKICGSFGSQIQQIANAVPLNLAEIALKLIMCLEGESL